LFRHALCAKFTQYFEEVIHAQTFSRQDRTSEPHRHGIDVAVVGGKNDAEALRRASAALHRRMRQGPLVQGLRLHLQPDSADAVSLQRKGRRLFATALLTLKRQHIPVSR
jgi:hypothetical protein